uniref:WW domain-containing protein n=1 Tax=Haptolina ericina TaxID=156174 RepID=A0A7S3F137_9EUKA|mmetsp:Transcript_40346/g.91389  ORF Transcript_40346/g.91389 Transcript_40346/m.91389 type:complete len:178 (+) Transcript_40346:2-535(+)
MNEEPPPLQILVAAESLPLPEGWKCGWAAEWNRCYFFNSEEQLTQWDHPLAPPSTKTAHDKQTASSMPAGSMIAEPDSTSVEDEIAQAMGRESVDLAAWARAETQRREAEQRSIDKTMAAQAEVESDRRRRMDLQRQEALGRARRIWAELDAEARAALEVGVREFMAASSQATDSRW